MGERKDYVHETGVFGDLAGGFPCFFLLCLTCIIVGLSGCSSEGEKSSSGKSDKELLVFCGITMIDPVQELMDIFSKEHGVRTMMSYGGSADLMKSIILNKTGDIYFPGNKSFIDEGEQKDIILDSKQVGVNQAAFLVTKGNPKGLTGDIKELLRSDLHIAIGHPELGSIGKEARRILQAAGIYDEVVEKAAMLQPDSRTLTKVLLEEKVDVVLNWKAVRFIPENKDKMDVVPIKNEAAPAHPLVMAVTTYSADPDIARAFLELCNSERGRVVFENYGF